MKATQRSEGQSIGKTLLIVIMTVSSLAYAANEALRPRASLPPDSPLHTVLSLSPNGDFELIEVLGRDAIRSPYFSFWIRRKGEQGRGIQITGWTNCVVGITWRPDNSIQLQEPREQWYWWCQDEALGLKIHKIR